MKGKVKSVFTHIINIIFAIAAGLVFGVVISLIVEDMAGGETPDALLMLLLIFSGIPTITSLLSELVLIINQAKHRYDPYILATGLLNNVFLLITSILVFYLTFKRESPEMMFIIIGLVILILALINLFLYILINHDNKAIFAASVKAIKKPEEKAVEKKPVAKKKPTAKKKK